jgi:hypothetical protein
MAGAHAPLPASVVAGCRCHSGNNPRPAPQLSSALSPALTALECLTEPDGLCGNEVSFLRGRGGDAALVNYSPLSAALERERQRASLCPAVGASARCGAFTERSC